MKKALNLLGFIAVLAVIGFVTIACDDGSGVSDGGSGGNVVNRTGEAWVGEFWNNRRGYIFSSDGTFDFLREEGNFWEISDSGTYMTSGSKLILTFRDSPALTFSETYNYSVSGNTLKMTMTREGISQTLTLAKTNIVIAVFTPPSSHIPLTNGQWVNGSINIAGSEAWYSFTVIAGTTYRVWWNDSYDGDYTKTLDVMVRAYNINGTQLFNEDSAWYSPRSFTPSLNSTIFLRVTGYDDYDTGTFAIVYSTGSTRP